MALRYLDSCGDHYTAADATMKWTSAHFHTLAAGVHGQCMSGDFRKGLVFGSTTVILEARIRCWSIVAGGLFSVADALVNPQVTTSIQGDGAIVAARYGGATLGMSVPDTIRLLQWYHLGVRIKVDASAGELEVRINGAPVIGPLTGLNTTGLSWSGALHSFLMGDTTNAVQFDDLVVMDDVDDGLDDPRLPGGGGYDKFLGSVEVRVKRPNGVGLKAQWTPAPTQPNWVNLVELTPDGDTTTNRVAAGPGSVGLEDLVAMDDLASGEDILAAQLLVASRKTQEGTAAIALLTNQGGTITASSPFYIDNTYTYAHIPLATAPSGALWSKAIWDALQCGYRKAV